MSLEQKVVSEGKAAQPVILCDAFQKASYLSLKDVSVAYQSPVIEGVSFDVPKNQVTALLGPSGCGKSSLLMAINHLAQEQGAQVSGDILHCGGSILTPSIDLMQLRRQIGYIFQRPNPFPLSIYKNLDMPLREHGVDRATRAAKIEHTLKAVGLWDQVRNRLNQSALDLSGGQQQRLCIARALVLEPKILLMDEPCSALDPMAGALIEDLILKLQKDVTIVIVTHNIAQAKRVAQQVAFFWMKTSGFLVENQTAERFFSEPSSELAKVYIAH